MDAPRLLPFVVVPRLVAPLVHQKEESPFVRSADERNLRVLVDDAPVAAPDDELQLLLELGRLPSIDLTTTAPTGPNWIEVSSTIVGDDQLEVRTHHDNGFTQSDVWPASTWRLWASQHAARSGEALDSAERRFLLAGAADHRVDSMVTLNTNFGGLASRSNPMSVREALALVGVFLRSRSDGAVDAPGGRPYTHVAIGTQQFIAARCLLDQGWRWWSACVESNSVPGAEHVMRTAAGLQVRFERAMRARDAVLIDCMKPFRKASDREVLYHLDALLLWLGGAFDVTALIANHAHAVGSRDDLVGWRRGGWRKSIGAAASRLADLTHVGQPVRSVIDLVAAFRNTVHGAPVTSVAVSAHGVERHLIELPDRTSQEVEAACETIGGSEAWGLVDLPLGSLGSLWDPHRLVQMLLPFAAAALNEIMRLTEVERLPGVTASSSSRSRPTDGFFEPEIARRVLLLHGFTP